MDKWHLSVPKILHLYHGGEKLTYMRYLTVKSFMKHNPDWQIVFWHPDVPFKGKSWGIGKGHQYINYKLCKDYLPELLALPIIKEAVDFSKIGFAPNMAEVHKNDYIRIYALSEYGGVWSDTDIIYFKPMNALAVNKLENKDKETYVCIGSYGHSTGLNMATERSRFFDSLFECLAEEYKKLGYQCWGPDMFNKYFKTFESIPNAVNLGMDVVYAHDCHHVQELLTQIAPRFTEGSIGCHWYGGNSIWGKFINQTKGGEENLPKCIISDLINEAK